MCMNQINAAINKMQNARIGSDLIQAQSQALAFINASFELKEISNIQKQSLEKKVRRIYRNQLIGGSA